MMLGPVSAQLASRAQAAWSETPAGHPQGEDWDEARVGE